MLWLELCNQREFMRAIHVTTPKLPEPRSLGESNRHVSHLLRIPNAFEVEIYDLLQH